ncbi:MAG: hypothetical protein ACP5IC_01450 [Minisyncoccia bacterium]
MKLNSGQAVLPLVLLIGTIILVVAVTGSISNLFGISSGQVESAGIQALNAAQSGVEDAFLRITRNKDLLVVNAQPLNYNLNINNSSVSVSITRPASTYYQITSIGSNNFTIRKVLAIISVNTFTGKVSIQSTQEVTVQ